MDRKSRLKRRRILRAAEAAKPVSMRQFLEAVGKIAAKNGEDYYRVNVQLLHSTFRPKDAVEIEYIAYINGFKQVSAPTIHEALRLMQNLADIKRDGIALGFLPPTADVLVDV